MEVSVEQIMILLLLVGLIWLAVLMKLVINRVQLIATNALSAFYEHKRDALNLESQIKSIEPNLWVDGKKPVPIRPPAKWE